MSSYKFLQEACALKIIGSEWELIMSISNLIAPHKKQVNSWNIVNNLHRCCHCDSCAKTKRLVVIMLSVNQQKFRIIGKIAWLIELYRGSTKVVFALKNVTFQHFLQPNIPLPVRRLVTIWEQKSLRLFSNKCETGFNGCSSFFGPWHIATKISSSSTHFLPLKFDWISSSFNGAEKISVFDFNRPQSGQLINCFPDNCVTKSPMVHKLFTGSWNWFTSNEWKHRKTN